ncbi:hypothetical protein NVP1209O_60 [Vibrio phage 1.209.O._10N.222.52.B2]|nr:hypothetical protein NVP1209O_60 [Vibrio phage 1.209.O._10N.222.52.B2]
MFIDNNISTDFDTLNENDLRIRVSGHLAIEIDIAEFLNENWEAIVDEFDADAVAGLLGHYIDTKEDVERIFSHSYPEYIDEYFAEKASTDINSMIEDVLRYHTASDIARCICREFPHSWESFVETVLEKSNPEFCLAILTEQFPVSTASWIESKAPRPALEDTPTEEIMKELARRIDNK